MACKFAETREKGLGEQWWKGVERLSSSFLDPGGDMAGRASARLPKSVIGYMDKWVGVVTRRRGSKGRRSCCSSRAVRAGRGGVDRVARWPMHYHNRIPLLEQGTNPLRSYYARLSSNSAIAIPISALSVSCRDIIARFSRGHEWKKAGLSSLPREDKESVE